MKKPAAPLWQELSNSRYPGQGNEATGKARFPIDVGDTTKKPAGLPGAEVPQIVK